MTAMTVIPEIVRATFLLNIGRSLRLSSALSKHIISEFEGISTS
jgi:hypothetical protein